MRFPLSAACAVVSVLLPASITGADGDPDRPDTPAVRSQREVRYRVTDLGTLPHCGVTYATGVNDSGLVVGYAYMHVPPGHGNSILSRPFRWENGRITELEKLGGEYGQALTVNSRGDIGGYANLPDHDHRPVVWRRVGGYRSQPVSTYSGRVMALNDSGVAAGHINEFDAMKNRRLRACIWKDGREEIVGREADAESVATGIAQGGAAVGYFVPAGRPTPSDRGDGESYAAIWQVGMPGDMDDRVGKPQTAHLPGRYRGRASAVNAAGIAVGWVATENGKKASVWRDGKQELLPSIEGFSSEAHSINSRGQVVGEAMEHGNRPGWVWAAYLWQDGKAYDLNKLIPSNSGWKLSVAKQISGRGLIVGYGTYDKFPRDSWRAFLLTPVEK